VQGVGRETLEDLVNRYNEQQGDAARAALRRRVNAAVNPYLAVAVRDTCGSCNALLAQVVHWSGLLDADNGASSAVASVVMSWIRAHYLYVCEIQRYSETIPLVLGVLATDAAPTWDIGNKLPVSPTRGALDQESGSFPVRSAERLRRVAA
jgi:hypothetical protein